MDLLGTIGSPKYCMPYIYKLNDVMVRLQRYLTELSPYYLAWLWQVHNYVCGEWGGGGVGDPLP